MSPNIGGYVRNAVNNNPIRGARVSHQALCQDGCAAPARGDTSDRSGHYAASFITTNPQSRAHLVNCTAQGYEAAAQLIETALTSERQLQQLDFALNPIQLTHACGAACKTKDTPCARPTTNPGACWQHVGIA